VASSVEETGVALSAVAARHRSVPGESTREALIRGAAWLVEAYRQKEPLPAPIGLYFARLWYFEELYPLIFAVDGLASARLALAGIAAAGG
jgi:squalene-hopene/tetraprenyl-beta-curcumene cyclase